MIAFTGCDFIKEKVEYFQETIEDMNKKQSIFKKVIKDNYGLNSKVAWEINNDILTQVTVFLMLMTLEMNRFLNWSPHQQKQFLNH